VRHSQIHGVRDIPWVPRGFKRSVAIQSAAAGAAPSQLSGASQLATLLGLSAAGLPVAGSKHAQGLEGPRGGGGMCASRCRR
jgi:hypothetical protein